MRDDAVGLGDRLQLVEPADEDRRRNVAHVLGHPQADIGRARRRSSLPARPADSAARSSSDGRHQQPLLARPDLDAAAVAHRGKPGSDRLALDSERVLGGLAIAGDRHAPRARSPRSRCSGRDCPAAPFRSRRSTASALRHPQRIERHDEARRAEAALRAVEIDHRLLHRMQAAVACPAGARRSRHGSRRANRRSGCRR